MNKVCALVDMVSRSDMKSSCLDISNYMNEKGSEELFYNNIFLPENAPKEFEDRNILWNSVIEKENESKRSKTAQEARRIILPLPNELGKEINSKVLTDISNMFTELGMCVDCAGHYKNNNIHGHLLLSTRDIYNFGFGNKNRDWNSKEFLHNTIKKNITEIINNYLPPEKKWEWIDYEEAKQKKEFGKSVHLGSKATARLKKIDEETEIKSKSIDEKYDNKNIEFEKYFNKKMNELNKPIKKTESEITADIIKENINTYSEQVKKEVDYIKNYKNKNDEQYKIDKDYILEFQRLGKQAITTKFENDYINLHNAFNNIAVKDFSYQRSFTFYKEHKKIFDEIKKTIDEKIKNIFKKELTDNKKNDIINNKKGGKKR